MTESGDRRFDLLLDELDDPLARLEGRVFLNLRARRDQFGVRLSYVTAIDRHLGLISDGGDVGVSEFCELFAAREYHLRPMAPHDTPRFLRRVSGDAVLEPIDDLLRQVAAQVGGHPGLRPNSPKCNPGHISLPPPVVS